MKKLLIIFAVLCLAAPVMAADWNFYGSARVKTFWNQNDFGPEGSQADDLDVQWENQGNARIGATVKVNDQIGGGFEYGNGPNLRKLYGTYTFGNGSELLIGQTYPPTSGYFYSDSVFGDDGDLLGMGQFYAGRSPMIQWSMGGFKVALVKPTTGATVVKGDNDDAEYRWNTLGGGTAFFQGTEDDADAFEEGLLDAGTITKEEAASRSVAVGPTGAFEVKDTDTTFPKIEANYRFKTDMFFVDVYGGYQMYELDGEKVAGSGKTYDIDSYVVGVGGGANFGALYAKLGAHMGLNLQNYGAAGWLTPFNLNADDSKALADAKIGAAGYDSVKDEIIDNDALGYLAVLGFKASEMFNIEVGYGKQIYELDVNNSKKDEADQMYLNCTITIAPGFFIVPEVGQVNWDVQEVDAGDFTYYGAKWQVNF